MERSLGLVALVTAAVGFCFACGCPQQPSKPPAEKIPLGSNCSSLVIACYDEFARGSIDLLCVRPISRWNRTALTWRLVDADSAAQVEAVIQAFDAWSAASALTFTQAAEGADADITLSFAEAAHGDPFDFDPDSGVLGHAYFPGTIRAGAVHLFGTKADNWSPPQAVSDIQLFAVALHEIGHSLGLTHSEDDNAVMAPVYHAEETVALTSGDISAIQRLYGSRDGSVTPDAVLPPGNCDDAPGNLVDPDGDGDEDNPDCDGDGIPDTVEVFVFDTDPCGADTDGDGKNDFQEIFVDGTPPGVAGEANAVDSDQDGLNDDREHDLGTDADNPDTDDDDLSDGLEVFYYGTNPLLVDTDGDQLPDGNDPFPTIASGEPPPPSPVRDCNENFIPDSTDIGAGTSADCNSNAAPDECDIAEGTSSDADGDGVPDECPPLCDDGDGCTFDRVIDGECVHAPCDDGLFCNGVETCVDGQCAAGADPCVGAAFCDEANDVCVPFGGGPGPVCTAESCNDGLFCNGVETCNPALGCADGEDPCDPQCGYCDEANDRCRTTCQVDSDCDDGLFCSGAEFCGSTAAGLPGGGCCFRGKPRCSGKEICDENTDACRRPCANDADCNDDLFCNGTEFCVPPLDGVGTGLCFAGVPPTCDDEVACTIDFCDAKVDACVFIPNDRFCDDGVFCNGFETCSPCEPSQRIVPGGFDCANGCRGGEDPCARFEQLCDEPIDQCVECLKNAHCDDGDACTNDLCVGIEGECMRTLLDCDDGLFCNGVEFCDPAVGCLDGADPCDSQCGICDETHDQCNTFCKFDSDCDDGIFCNGKEVCDGCCFFGAPPCSGNQLCDEKNDICRTPCVSNAQCNDGNRCTDEACVVGFCVYADNSAPCSDGLFCNGADACQAGTCSLHTGDPCVGGGECKDQCSEETDSCFDPFGTPCTDDGNECTDNVCDGDGSCVPIANTAPCDDGFFCNGDDFCLDGACIGHAGNPCPAACCGGCSDQQGGFCFCACKLGCFGCE